MDEHYQRTCQRGQRALLQGDRARENPPDEWDCREDGHKWRRIPGEAKDGTRFVRCIKCGLEEEL